MIHGRSIILTSAWPILGTKMISTLRHRDSILSMPVPWTSTPAKSITYCLSILASMRSHF